MKVLFISDNYYIGGFESHLLTYFKYLKMNKWSIIFATRFTKEKPYFKDIDLFVDRLYNLNFNDYSSESVLSLADQINEIILNENIDLVHIHPFLSIYGGFLSCVENNKPAILTLHGKLSLFSYSSSSSNYFLNNVILPSIKILTVNKNIFETYKDKLDIHYLPNPIDEKFWIISPEFKKENYLLIVSRLDPDKIHSLDIAIQKLQKFIKENNLKLSIKVAGGGSTEEFLTNKYPEVEFLGYKNQNEIKYLMGNANAVFGMCRVILESLYLGKVTFLINYEGEIIHINEKNIKDAEEFNFEGTGLHENITSSLFEKIIQQHGHDISKEYLDKFSAQNIISKYIEFAKKSVGNFNTYDKNIVTATHFYKNLLKLDCKLGEYSLLKSQIEENKARLEAINLRVEEYKKEKEKLNSQIEEYKKQNEKLNSQIEQYKKEKEKLSEELNIIYLSDFWKVAQLYYKIRDNTPLKYIHTILGILRHEGIGGLMIKLKNKFREFSTYTRRKKTVQKIAKLAVESKKKGKKVFIYPITVDWHCPLFQRPHQMALHIARKGDLYIHITGNFLYDNVNGMILPHENLIVTNLNMVMNHIKNYYFILSSTTGSVMNLHTLLTLKKLNGIKIIYDYIDEIHEDICGDIGFVEAQKERHFGLKSEDVFLVTASALKLYNEMVKRFPQEKVLYLPNACDYEHFHIEKKEPPDEFRKLVSMKKPIIGYYGALAKWLDYALLEYLADRCPDINIVLLGTDYDGSLKQLKNKENLFVFKEVDYNVLPQYAIWFDVAIIPFKEGEIAKSTSPIKLFEYMAMNKPVVYTKDLDECKLYKTPLMAENKDDFVRKIQIALKLKDNQEYISLIDKEARENTWKSRVEKLYEKIQELEEKNK